MTQSQQLRTKAKKLRIQADWLEFQANWAEIAEAVTNTFNNIANSVVKGFNQSMENARRQNDKTQSEENPTIKRTSKV